MLRDTTFTAAREDCSAWPDCLTALFGNYRLFSGIIGVASQDFCPVSARFHALPLNGIRVCGLAGALRPYYGLCGNRYESEPLTARPPRQSATN